ncbi:MAG: site-2 protease family protein, partial [Betaproteobacteria bacterium AqS2]|nr:site-2 protease family protein [Betaproteobacteria bacterium AqS2]
MIELLLFLVVVVIVVSIHEMGHYLAARSCGVRVLRFAVGFGKPLLSRFDRRGTEWCL